MTTAFQHSSEDIHLSADSSGLADNASVSDTDGSRAEGSAAEDGRGQDQPTALKKATSFKPVTFAKSKFPVSRGAAALVGSKPVGDKGISPLPFLPRPCLTCSATTPSTNSSAASLAQGSRPRLVAKSTSGLGNTAKNSKTNGRNGAIPDPMQVWNKNRGSVYSGIFSFFAKLTDL